MTITATVSEIEYAGDGVSTVFAIPFVFDTSADLKVVRTDTDGNAVELSTGFSITGGGGSTGNITLSTALASGYTLTIIDDPDLTQPTDYVANDDFPAESHEDALDRGVRISKRILQIVKRALRTADGDPSGESEMLLPSVQSRKGKVLGFNATTGAPEMVASVTNVGSLSASIIGGFLYAQTTAESAAGVTPTLYQYPPGDIRRYGADGTGVSDCATAITNAWLQYQQATGSPIYAPAGTYRVNSQITFTSASSPTFRQGPVIIGDGRERTIFDSRVASGHLFSVVAGGTAGSTFVTGARFVGFKIINTGAPASSSGIRLLTSYQTDIEDVWITGLTGNGITVPCILGDNDASNMVKLRQVRIDTCAGWGIKADGDSGRNETSFMYLEHVFIQGCGTNVVGTPTSGGMIWKGQVLTLQQCAFTINENVALYIPGQAGLGQSVDIQNTSIENNKKRGVYCTGVQAFRARNIQFYNNNTYTATNACEFDGTSFVVRSVDIDGSVVRATSGNSAYTAFKISGTNADLQSCRVRRVVWDNFDYTGQTRFDGWLFDHVPQECQLVVDSATSLIFRAKQTFGTGRVSPLRLRGGAGGTPSTSGEWIAYAPGTAGVSITNASLANSTRYYAYLYDNNGAPALELSTSAPALDTASGYMVKTADATRLYVGSVITDGSAQFLTSATGWLNPETVLLGASQLGAPYYRWRDSTGDVRVSSTAPTSDTDGTIVGTQT